MKENVKIRIEGHLEKKWETWFDGMQIQYNNGDTIITGLVHDKARLHGMLNLIRDLNLDLISVIVKDK